MTQRPWSMTLNIHPIKNFQPDDQKIPTGYFQACKKYLVKMTDVLALDDEVVCKEEERDEYATMLTDEYEVKEWIFNRGFSH